MSEKLLIKNVQTMTFFNDGYNAIKILPADVLIENGKIKEIDRNLNDADAQVVDGGGKLCVPGLINGRSRSLASRVSKGLAEDIRVDRYGNTPLYTRVNPYINIALEILSEEELQDVLAPSLYEAVDSGTTTLFEHCTGAELPSFLRLCDRVGLRTIAAPMLMSRTTLPEADAWGNYDKGVPSDETALLQWNRTLADEYSSGRVRAVMGLGSVDTTSELLIRRAAQHAMDTSGILMVSVDETKHEREQSYHKYGASPIEVLCRNHALHEKTLLGGLQHTSPEDRKTISHFHAQAVTCLYQAMLDAELIPFIDFLIDDVHTIIGTGRCSVDMMAQMRMIALAGKLGCAKRYQMRSQDAFYAATVGGGRAIGENFGRLEPGCEADLILIDISHPRFHPYILPVKELVYQTNSSDVTDVIVEGRFLKRNGKVLWANPFELNAKAEQAMEKVWQRAREVGAL